MAVGQSFAFVRAHKAPVSIVADTFHEQIWNPESVEKITGTIRLVSVVLAKIEEGENVSMPWLKVDRNTSLALFLDCELPKLKYHTLRNQAKLTFPPP
jgi:hypothetical protein